MWNAPVPCVVIAAYRFSFRPRRVAREHQKKPSLIPRLTNPTSFLSYSPSPPQQPFSSSRNLTSSSRLFSSLLFPLLFSSCIVIIPVIFSSLSLLCSSRLSYSPLQPPLIWCQVRLSAYFPRKRFRLLARAVGAPARSAGSAAGARALARSAPSRLEAGSGARSAQGAILGPAC